MSKKIMGFLPVMLSGIGDDSWLFKHISPLPKRGWLLIFLDVESGCVCGRGPLRLDWSMRLWHTAYRVWERARPCALKCGSPKSMKGKEPSRCEEKLLLLLHKQYSKLRWSRSSIYFFGLFEGSLVVEPMAGLYSLSGLSLDDVVLWGGGFLGGIVRWCTALFLFNHLFKERDYKKTNLLRQICCLEQLREKSD